MKNIHLITILIVTTICHAQTPIYSSKGWSGNIPVNSYIKDMDNDMNSFVGEYEYNNNGTIFSLKLIKKTMVPMEPIGGYLFHYEDLIIGEIEYTVQNVNTLVNTMGNINTNFVDPYNHAIVGSMIIDNNDYGYCPDCSPNEIRINASMFDGVVYFDLMLRMTTVSGQPALRIHLGTNHVVAKKSGEPAEIPIIPDGEYVLLKIN